jgi:hypothetical protein
MPRLSPVAASFCVSTALLTAGSGASLAAPEDAVDIASIRDKMSLVTDGKGHYMVYAPLAQMSEFLFYGDGKDFYQQRVFSGSSEGDIAFSRTFWEPRGRAFSGASFAFAKEKYSVECGSRAVEMTRLPDAEAKAMVAAAAWHKPRWKWRAYLLARDENARYYYVDRAREPEGNKNFRLFVGPKGSLKLQKMTNVVSDSEGDIFSTKTGSLRLISTNKADSSAERDSTWVEGPKKVKLTSVPVEKNAPMIYTELGVYAGEKLGTPCDDM